MNPDPTIFIIDLQGSSAYYLSKVHLHDFSRFFLLFLLNERRIRIQEAQKHVDPVDPDPESDPGPQHLLLAFRVVT
jgi:hypothetical protein